MKKHGKRYINATKIINKTKLYNINEAIDIIKQINNIKFDETIEIHIKTNCNKHCVNQQMQNSVLLPHGTGKSIRTLVLAKNDEIKNSINSGADYIGNNDLIEKIKNKHWLDFDIVIATPKMMSIIGKHIGHILGPKGLMPNLKSGTITNNICKTIKEIKNGKIEYRFDKTFVIHSIIGKKSFAYNELIDNFNVLIKSVIKNKPTLLKTQYLKTIFITTTMGPSIKIDISKYNK